MTDQNRNALCKWDQNVITFKPWHSSCSEGHPRSLALTDSLIFSEMVQGFARFKCHCPNACPFFQRTVVNMSPCFSTSKVNPAIGDYSNATRQWIKYNWWPVTSMQVIWRHHIWHHHWSRNRGDVIARDRRVRAVGEVSLCLSCHVTSTDAQHDLPGSLTDQAVRPDRMIFFQLTFLGENAYFSMQLDSKITLALSIFLFSPSGVV